MEDGAGLALAILFRVCGLVSHTITRAHTHSSVSEAEPKAADPCQVSLKSVFVDGTYLLGTPLMQRRRTGMYLVSQLREYTVRECCVGAVVACGDGVEPGSTISPQATT